MEFSWRKVSFDRVIWGLVWRLKHMLFYNTLTIVQLASTSLVFQYMVLDFFAERHGGGGCDKSPSSDPCREASSDAAVYYGVAGGITSCTGWFMALSLGSYSDTAGRRPIFKIRTWISMSSCFAFVAHVLFGASIWPLLVLRPAEMIFDTSAVMLAGTYDLVPQPDQRAPAMAVIIGGFVAAATFALPLGALLPPEIIAAISAVAAVSRLAFLYSLFPETAPNKAETQNMWDIFNAPIAVLPMLTRNSFIIRMAFVLVCSSLSQAGLVTILMPYLQGYLGITRETALPLIMACVASGVVAYSVLLRPFVAHLGQVWALRLCLGFSCAFPLLLAACDSVQHLALMCFIAVGPLTLLSPVVSSIKGNLVAPDEQGLMQGVLAAVTSLACGICDLLFGWLYAFSTRGGTVNDRSAAFPPLFLCSFFGLLAFVLSCNLPLSLPPPRAMSKEFECSPSTKALLAA